MARCVAWIVVLAVLMGCGARERPAPDLPRLTPAVAHALDEALRAKVEASGVPGAAASVVYADGEQWSGAAGHAVLEPARPMTPDTALPFDSVTKLAVAALALRLTEQDRLDLDDPIRRWYPRWRGDPAATVRDLLGHTSGMGDPPESFWADVMLHPRRIVTPRAYLAATPKPDSRTTVAEYSNAGFVLLGLLLERAADAPLAVAMRRQVLNHPGGDGLALQPDERAAKPHAYSYWYPRGIGEPVAANDGGPLLPSRAWAVMTAGAGSLAGDVPSLARWGHELFGGRILEPASLDAMTRFRLGGHWRRYGLGVAQDELDGQVMWGHGGDGLGSHTEFWHLPKERLTVAVAWNDDLIDRDGGILSGLLRAALGDYQR